VNDLPGNVRIYSINLKKSRSIGPVNPAQNVNEGTFTDVCERQRCKANREPLGYNNRTALDVRYLVYLGHGKQREQRSPRQTSRIGIQSHCPVYRAQRDRDHDNVRNCCAMRLDFRPRGKLT